MEDTFQQFLARQIPIQAFLYEAIVFAVAGLLLLIARYLRGPYRPQRFRKSKQRI